MGRVESTKPRRIHLLMLFLALFTVAPLVSPPEARAQMSRGAFESCLLDEANVARSQIGVSKLKMARDQVPPVRDWSEWMRFNDFRHMFPSLRADILPDSWTTYGENIAMHSYREMADCEPIHELWMTSPGHRENILDSEFRFVAIGTYVDGTGWWATQLFFDASGYPATCNGTFCDDDGNTFESDIERIAHTGITQGCNPPVNDMFCPSERVTRAEMAAFLARALELHATGSVDFIDDNGSTFENAIEQIATAGITHGCNPPTNNRFCPNDHVTRGEMAAFLARALGL